MTGSAQEGLHRVSNGDAPQLTGRGEAVGTEAADASEQLNKKLNQRTGALDDMVGQLTRQVCSAL